MIIDATVFLHIFFKSVFKCCFNIFFFTCSQTIKHTDSAAGLIKTKSRRFRVSDWSHAASSASFKANSESRIVTVFVTVHVCCLFCLFLCSFDVYIHVSVVYYECLLLGHHCLHCLFVILLFTFRHRIQTEQEVVVPSLHAASFCRSLRPLLRAPPFLPRHPKQCHSQRPLACCQPPRPCPLPAMGGAPGRSGAAV